jgi:hypothetical protein
MHLPSQFKFRPGKNRPFQSKMTKAKKRQDTAAKMKFKAEEADGLNGRKPRELDATQDRTVRVGDTFVSRYISFAFFCSIPSHVPRRRPILHLSFTALLI